MPIQIDSDIPPPPPRPPKWDFHEMKVGDSFFVPQRKARSVRSCAGAYGKRHPPFAYRAEKREEKFPDDKGKEVKTRGIRLWRTA